MGAEVTGHRQSGRRLSLARVMSTLIFSYFLAVFLAGLAEDSLDSSMAA